MSYYYRNILTKTLCAFVFLVAVNISLAQQRNTALLHFDKPYYVVGELVNYKVYLPPAVTQSSPMLEVKLYERSGKSVHRSFLKPHGGIGVYGHYKIPFDLEAGAHQLVISALAEAAGEKMEIISAPLPIFSDSDPLETTDSLKKTNYSTPELSGFDLDIAVRLQKEKFRSREQIELIVEVKDAQGNPTPANMSISVTDIGVIGADTDHPYRTLQAASVPLNPSRHLSEYIPFNGRLENQKEGELLTFYMPFLNKIYYITSGVNGVFQLLLPGFYGDQSLQYIGQFSSDAGINRLEEQIASNSETLRYTPVIKTYIEESRKRKVIYQVFNRTESNYQLEIPGDAPSISPDREYLASNYPFKDLPAFCRQLSTQLKYVSDKKGKHEFKMFNPESRNFYFGAPLFIVDRQLTKEAAFLESLDFQELDRIGLYYDNQRLSDNFGFAGFGGVVVIDSKEGDLKVPDASRTQEFQLNGMQPTVVRDDSIDAEVDQPIFKPQLLWLPSEETDAQGRFITIYQQSDDISNFQIEIVAQDKNGNRGFARINYEVIP